MEESKRNHDKKKMAVKIGGGGGIGAVVLLGGALATAALASAFAVRKLGRSSGKDHRRRRRQSPPPENNKLHKEKDGLEKEQQFVFIDQIPSNGEIEEVEPESDAAFLVSTLDEKPRDEEINGGTPGNICDIEVIELKNESICNGSVVIEKKMALLDEKLPFESHNLMHEDESSIHSTKENTFSNEILKESQNLEQVHTEEEKAESEPSRDGEIDEMSQDGSIELTGNQQKKEENCCDQEVIKVIQVDNEVEKVHIDQMEVQKSVNMEVNMEKRELEGIVFESHGEDEEKALEPVFHSSIIQHENVNGDQKECALVNEIEETIQEDEAIEEIDQEDEAKYNIEEQSVEQVENCDQPDEVIVPEKVEDLTEEKEHILPCDDKEENAGFVFPTLENKTESISVSIKEITNNHGSDNEVVESVEHRDELDTNNEEKGVEKEPICLENVQVTKDGATNEDVVTKENCEDELEINIEEKEVEKELICLENIQVAKDDAINEDVETNETCEEMEVKKEQICPENIEVTKDDATNEDFVETDENKTSLEFIVTAKKDDPIVKTSEYEEVSTKDIDNETAFSNEVQFTDQEVEGKVQEDKTVKKDEHNSNNSRIIGDDSVSDNLGKTFTNKYFEMAKLNEHLTNSTSRKIIIATMSVLSSLSCSWFFGLSFIKLCLIVFLTMVLSTMHGY